MTEANDDHPRCGNCDGAGGGCGGTGGHAHAGYGASSYTPELDARTIDPVIRQSAIFGVLVGMPPGGSVTVISPQNPQPIVELLHDRLPNEYAVDLSQCAEDEWRVTFARR